MKLPGLQAAQNSLKDFQQEATQTTAAITTKTNTVESLGNQLGQLPMADKLSGNAKSMKEEASKAAGQMINNAYSVNAAGTASGFAGAETLGSKNFIYDENVWLHNADNDEKQFQNIIKRAISISIFFIIPMSVGIAFLSKDVIQIIYERGEFTANSTLLTSGALQFYAVGMLGYGLMEVFNKAFYAKQDAKTPMIISGFAILLNVELSMLLVNQIGYKGLPMAAATTSLVTAVVMLVVMNKKSPGIVDKETLLELVKTVLAASVMGIVVYLAKTISLPVILSLIIAVGLGVLTYLVLAVVLKSSVAKEGIDMIKSKIKKNL